MNYALFISPAPCPPPYKGGGDHADSTHYELCIINYALCIMNYALVYSCIAGSASWRSV